MYFLFILTTFFIFYVHLYLLCRFCFGFFTISKYCWGNVTSINSSLSSTSAQNLNAIPMNKEGRRYIHTQYLRNGEGIFIINFQLYVKSLSPFVMLCKCYLK